MICHLLQPLLGTLNHVRGKYYVIQRLNISYPELILLQLHSFTLLELGGRGSGSEAAVSRCLLRYGADVQRRNNSGETPLDICRGTDVEQVIRDFAAKG